MHNLALRHRGTLRCDRLAWAQSVLGGELWFTYKGIANPDRDTRPSRHHTTREAQRNKLCRTLLGDEQYMQQLCDDEVKYQVESTDYVEQWEEHCRDVLHREGRCPNHEEQKGDFQKALDALVGDAAAREDWVREGFEWDWLRDHVQEESESIDFIEWFLIEHPIDGCMRKLGDGDQYAAVALADIVGYCPECNNPAIAEDIYVAEPDDDHVRYIVCPACSSDSDLDPPEAFMQTYNRPFNWPPDAPFPPRAHFDGTPLEAAPWET